MSLEKKVTVQDFIKKKYRGEKIVMLTAYDYITAKLVDLGGVDGILVGDSLGMVLLGYRSTHPVSMNEMLHHVKAVARANPRALIVADMPFGSYEVSKEEALKNAIKFVKAGADAVKIEGGKEIAEYVSYLVKFGIPVMGHIGLNPQRSLVIGGYRLMGKTVDQAIRVLEDAKALEEAGVFAIVIEHTVAEVAQEITKRIRVPTICIGSGPYCDGQILVLHDILGLSENIPYFAKKYIDLKDLIIKAVRSFVEEVRNGVFPSKEHYKCMKEAELNKFKELLRKFDG